MITSKENTPIRVVAWEKFQASCCGVGWPGRLCSMVTWSRAVTGEGGGWQEETCHCAELHAWAVLHRGHPMVHCCWCQLSLATLIRCGCDAFFFPCLLGASKINTSVRKAHAAIIYLFWLWGNLITCSLLPNPAPSSSPQCSEPSTTPLLNAWLSSVMLVWALACTAAHIWMYMHSSMLCNLDSPSGCMRHDAAYAYKPPRELTAAHSAIHTLSQCRTNSPCAQCCLSWGHSWISQPHAGVRAGGLRDHSPTFGWLVKHPSPSFLNIWYVRNCVLARDIYARSWTANSAFTFKEVDRCLSWRAM